MALPSPTLTRAHTPLGRIIGFLHKYAAVQEFKSCEVCLAAHWLQATVPARRYGATGDPPILRLAPGLYTLVFNNNLPLYCGPSVHVSQIHLLKP